MEPHFGVAFGIHFGNAGSLLGSLLETILVTFGVPVLHRFLEGFQDSPKVKDRLGWVVIYVVSGVQLTGLHQQDKQIYRWKPADLQTADQLICKQQTTDL